LARAVADELPPADFRLPLGEVLPASGRAIYLDADTVVNADLGELWRRDLGGATAGAVVDDLVRCRDAVGNWRELGRRRRVLQHRGATRGEFAQHDQYGLNVVLQGRWHTLGSLWNWGSDWSTVQPGSCTTSGTQAHDPRCRPRFRELLLEHLNATAWAGWRAYEPADAGTTFA
jgi:hypothetical protein